MRLYENELRLRELDKELEGISGELKSLFAVIGRTGEALTYEWIEAKRHRLAEEQRGIQAQIEEAERKLFSPQPIWMLRRARGKTRRMGRSSVYRRSSGGLRLNVDALATEMADLDRFLRISGEADGAWRRLGNRIHHSRHSLSLLSFVSGTDYGRSPLRCLPSVQVTIRPRTRKEEGCRTDQRDGATNQAVASATGRARKAVREIGVATGEQDALWQIASLRLREFSPLPSTEIQDRLRRLQRQAGYLDRQVEDLEQRAKAIALVSSLSARREELGAETGRLRAAIDSARAAQQGRFEKARELIASEVLDLVRHDLRREEAFENPREVTFDFAANRIRVDGQSYFSASSRAVLKSSFAAGSLIAATKDRPFRHPRFA